MDNLAIILADLDAAYASVETLEQVDALMGVLTAHRSTLPEESVEAKQITFVSPSWH